MVVVVGSATANVVCMLCCVAQHLAFVAAASCCLGVSSCTCACTACGACTWGQHFSITLACLDALRACTRSAALWNKLLRIVIGLGCSLYQGRSSLPVLVCGGPANICVVFAGCISLLLYRDHWIVRRHIHVAFRCLQHSCCIYQDLLFAYYTIPGHLDHLCMT